MLDKLLHRLKLKDNPRDVSGVHKKARSTDQHIGERKELRYEFSGLDVYGSLVKTRATRSLLHQQSRETSEWQLPLPYDLIILIIDTYFLQDEQTIRSLSITCTSLAHICYPLRFRTVTINTGNRTSPTSLERFAICLARSPDIVEFIQDLRITNVDDGVVSVGWQPHISAEGERLCFVLTRLYPNLMRLELQVVWSLIPIQLQHAFSVAFALPSLQVVVFRGRITLDILAHLRQITLLEIRGEVGLPADFRDCGDSFCTPERLRLDDPSSSGFSTTNLFWQNSPLKLTRLKRMEACMSSLSVPRLGTLIKMCATTLTTLHIYVDTWFAPKSVDLGPLAQLQDLLLGCNLEKMNIWDPIPLEVEERVTWVVSWVVSILTSLGPRPQPVSNLSHITILLHHKYFDFYDYVAWGTLDAIFGPVLERRWLRLRCVEIFYEPRLIREIIEPQMPVLHGAGVLKIC